MTHNLVASIFIRTLLQAFPARPYANKGPDGALFSVSSKYMDSELFYGFVEKLRLSSISHFYGPVLLI